MAHLGFNANLSLAQCFTTDQGQRMSNNISIIELSHEMLVLMALSSNKHSNVQNARAFANHLHKV